MAYRDDATAMLARIDALESQLRDQNTATEATRLRLERELAEVRLELATAREQAAQPERTPAVNRASSRIIMIVVLFFVGAGASVGIFLSSVASDVQGTITFTLPGSAAQTFKVNSCHSGNGFGPTFFGAQLETEGRPFVRVMPNVVTTHNLHGSTTALTPGTCTLFEVSVRWTGGTVNHVRAVAGHARLDCKLSDGSHIKADLEFDDCGR